MEYVLQDRNRGYCHKDGKIIIFNTPQEAQYLGSIYEQKAIEYAMTKDPSLIFKAQAVLNDWQLIEKDFTHADCGTINFNEIEF